MTAPARDPRHLLLVEDVGLAATLAPALTDAGWLVKGATYVREAIYTAQRFPVSALLVALDLPDERGDVAFFRLAAQYPWLRRRTLFLVQTDQEQAFVATAGHPWVRLPAPVETIVRAVTNVCGAPPR